MKIYTPPNPLPDDIKSNGPVMFLAGSIEMGKAEDWQSKFAKNFEELNCSILNPRRKDWDSTWKQSPDFEPFRTQVEWELNGIDLSDIIVVVFLGDTQSPVTMLELGTILGDENKRKKAIVCCPKTFWRYGNIAITCEKYGVTLYTDIKGVMLEARIKAIKKILTKGIK